MKTAWLMKKKKVPSAIWKPEMETICVLLFNVILAISGT